MCPALWDDREQILLLFCMTAFQIFEKCYHITPQFSFLRSGLPFPFTEGRLGLSNFPMAIEPGFTHKRHSRESTTGSAARKLWKKITIRQNWHDGTWFNWSNTCWRSMDELHKFMPLIWWLSHTHVQRKRRRKAVEAKTLLNTISSKPLLWFSNIFTALNCICLFSYQ